MIKFTVTEAPITKKNHQQIYKNSRTGKPFVTQSEQYKRYETLAMWQMPRLEKPLDTPVEVTCTFYMPSRRRVDLTNLLEAIDDIMVKAGVLKDDDSSIIVSHDGSRVRYDKEHPRTEVVITEVEI